PCCREDSPAETFCEGSRKCVRKAARSGSRMIASPETAARGRNTMPHALYVCLQDEDKIAVFAIDADSGQLTRRNDVAAAGGPSVMAISPDRQVLYVGHRTQPAISSFR